MSSSAGSLRLRLITPLEGAIEAWYDAAASGRAVWIFLGLFVAAWTSFQVISYASIGIHLDLAEIFVWSRHPAAGYYKHPPLAPLIAAAWFALFPIADWSYDLLAMVNSAVGLYAVDLVARRHVEGDKRLLVLLLLLLTPFYQFHGQRFSTNQVLLSTWPIATWCFLRAFETRTLLWSVAAGATAALAMQGKYYSVYLVAGIIIAALAHPRRWDYLRSASPWISVLTGLLLLGPHLYWLATTGAQPIAYGAGVHGHDPTAVMLRKTISYAVLSVGYVVLPFAVYWLAVRPDRRALAQAAWPADPDRRMLVILLAVLLVLPMLTAPLAGISLTSLWSMDAWFLLPVVLLAPKEVSLARPAAVRVALLVLAVTAGSLAAAPALAWMRHRDDYEGRGYERAYSEQLTRAWHETTLRPLTIVLGDPALTLPVTFYSPDHPDAVPGYQIALAPWVTPERMQREGFAAVCHGDDAGCITGAVQAAANDPRMVISTYQTAVPFLGDPGAPARFTFVLVPPRN